MASAAAAASAKNNRRNNKSANNIKIISFNVASPEFMCFNMHIPPSSEGSKFGCHANKETEGNTIKRAELIVEHLNLQNDVDFMCFQEMFPELNVKIQTNEKLKKKMTHMMPTHDTITTQTYYNSKKWTVTDLGFQMYYNQKKSGFVYYNSLPSTISSSRVGEKSSRTNILLCENRRNENEKFILINVHGEGSNKVNNEKLFNFINEFIKSNPILKDLKTITVGDFNYDPNTTKPDTEEEQTEQTEYIDIEKIFNSDIKYNNLNEKTSYHRWVWKSGEFTDKKGTDTQYALYDYVLLKKDSFKEVKITRIPKNFENFEVPYKCDENEQKEIRLFNK